MRALVDEIVSSPQLQNALKTAIEALEPFVNARMKVDDGGGSDNAGFIGAGLCLGDLRDAEAAFTILKLFREETAVTDSAPVHPKTVDLFGLLTDEEWKEVGYNVNRKTPGSQPDIPTWVLQEAVKYAEFLGGRRRDATIRLAEQRRACEIVFDHSERNSESALAITHAIRND